MSTGKRIPLILDTDIGTDIDDTWVLAVARRFAAGARIGGRASGSRRVADEKHLWRTTAGCLPQDRYREDHSMPRQRIQA